MNVTMFLFLFIAANLRAAESLPGNIRYAHYSDPTISFDYPAGWTLTVLPRRDLAGRCEIDVHRKRRWSELPNETSGWNDIQIVFFNLRERSRLIGAQGQRDDSIRSLADYRRQISCAGTGPTGKAYPPFFSQFVCERSLGVMPLAGAGTTGYLNRWIDTRVSNDPSFNRAFRETDVVFVDPKDPQWIYRADYFGPGAEFDRYYPAFKRLAASLRLSPNAAAVCGAAEAPPAAAAGAAPEPPAVENGAVPLLR